MTLAVADTPRPIEIPADLEASFVANPQARSFFDTVPSSLRRYHIDTINGAKTAETRRRRIEKAIGLFLAGKQR